MFEDFSTDDTAALEAIAKANGHDTDIECGYTKHVKTAESLTDFDDSRSRHWAKRGTVIAGDNFRVFENIQMTKGDQIITILIADRGDYRVAISI